MIRFGLAAFVLAGLAPSASFAATYIFADANGKATCSEIRLQQSAGVVGGLLDNTRCHPAGSVRGSGMEFRVAGYSGKILSFSYNQGRETVLFLIDEKALTWALYFAGPGGTGLVPQQVNSGALLPVAK